MEKISLSQLDRLVSEIHFVDRLVNALVNVILPKMTVQAACTGTYFCGTTATGEYCPTTCEYVTGKGCRKYRRPKVNNWWSTSPTCSNMCIRGTDCAASYDVGSCSPCAV